jgi:hypothetical protein
MSELYENFKQKIKDIEILPKNLITLLTYAMEVVELSQLKGSDQKDAALQLITQLIDESSLSVDIVKSGVASNAIDIIVDATKGKLMVNQHVKKAKGAIEQIKTVINVLRGCFKK